MTANRIYGDQDVRELPAYEVGEVAQYLGLSYVALYSWLRPITFSAIDGWQEKPIITRPRGSKKLSFFNLVEAHVVKALRGAHDVPLAEIRSAIDYAERELDIRRILVHQDLRTAGGGLFLDRVSDLVNIGRGGQLALRKVLDKFLERIEFADDRFPKELFPFVPSSDERIVAISPFFEFGKPFVSDRHIRTAVIADRFDLGESTKEIAMDYGLTEKQVEAAIIYERAA